MSYAISHSPVHEGQDSRGHFESTDKVGITDAQFYHIVLILIALGFYKNICYVARQSCLCLSNARITVMWHYTHLPQMNALIETH